MVLYCINNPINTIRMIVHKFKYHPDDEAVFLVENDVSSPLSPGIDKIRYYQTPDQDEMCTYSADSQEETKKHINRVISGFFKDIDLDPLQFSHIYSIFDMVQPFALYFEMNSIRYMLVECADNNMNYHNSFDITTRSNGAYAYNCIAHEMRLHAGYGDNCTKVFLYSGKSVYNAKPGKAEAEIFGFFETLIGLDEKYRRQLMEGYNMEQCDFDSVLLFNSPGYVTGRFARLQSGIPLKFMGENKNKGFLYFYNTILDYYFSDVDFLLKFHPNTEENIRRTFTGFKQISSHVPMELFFLLGKKFDIICPIYSTGVEIFRQNDYNTVVFGETILRFFNNIHFVFLAFTLINAVCLPGKICVSGLDISQMENFKNWVYKDFKDVEIEQLHGRGTINSNIQKTNFIVASPNAFFGEVIVDAPENCLIIARGSCRDDQHIFAAQEMTCSIIDVSGAEEEEIQSFNWTIMSKDREIVDALKEFSASYTLDRAKVRVETSPNA